MLSAPLPLPQLGSLLLLVVLVLVLLLLLLCYVLLLFPDQLSPQTLITRIACSLYICPLLRLCGPSGSSRAGIPDFCSSPNVALA